MTIDDFINHINVKCNQGCHFHMAIRAYISFIHDYNFDMNAETNCNLNNKPHYHYSMSTFNIVRKDNLLYRFSTCNIFDYGIDSINKAFKLFNFSMFDSLSKTYNVMNKANSSQAKNGSRKNSMIIFGSSLGATHFPKFPHDEEGTKHSMLPYPLANMSNNKRKIHFLREIWMRDLSIYAEKLTYEHLYNTMHVNKDNCYILNHLKFIKEKVHNSLRINDTIFTQLVLVAIHNVDSEMPPHLDPDDLISCIFTWGDLIEGKGGSTFYMNGLRAGKDIPACFHGKKM